jgi:hypothetical protein
VTVLDDPYVSDMGRDYHVRLERRDGGNVLGRFGGWLLMTFGCGLIALAAVFASEAAVAPIFAFGGIACFVLGPILSRMEGDFELTASSLKARLTAVQGVAQRDDLTLEDKADEIIRLMDTDEIAGDFAERIFSRSLASTAKKHPEGNRSEAPKLTGGSRANGTRVDARQRANEFERLVHDRLEAEGWDVESAPLHPVGYDFLAFDGQRRWYVEAKARRRLSTADVRSIIAQLQWAGRGQDDAAYALAVPAGSLTPSAQEAVRSFGPNYRVIELPFFKE